MSDIRKYTDEQYVEMEYWTDDEETKANSQKVVTVRKEQECMSIYADPHPIRPGTRAIREKAIHVDLGRVSCYMCLDHADEYIAEIHGE